MPDRTVNIKVLVDASQYDVAMSRAGASTETLSREMGKAAQQSEELAKASLTARSAVLDAAKASQAAATAQNKSTRAAERATKAQAEAAAASKVAADATQRLERGEIAEEEAKRLQAAAARKDRNAQLADAAAQRAAADAAEKLEKASIKTGLAQLAQGKAARSAEKDMVRSGENAGQGFLSGLKRVLGSAGGAAGASGPLAAFLVGAAIAAAPLAGGAIAGGILGGIATAGIGAAIAGQMNDPTVHGAWADFAAMGKQELSDVTVALAQPLADVASIFASQMAMESSTLTTFFNELAPSVDSVAQGFADFVGNAMTALPEVGRALAPVLNVLANLLPRVGLWVSQFLEDISSDSQGAAVALWVFAAAVYSGLKLADGAIVTAEHLLSGLFDAFKGIAAFMATLPGPIGDMGKAMLRGLNLTYDASTRAATGLDTLGQSTSAAARQAKELSDSVQQVNDQFDKLFGAAMSAAQADLKFKDDLASLTAEVRRNGTSLNAATSAGRQNREALLGIVQSAEQARDAYIQQHSATDGVAAATVAADNRFKSQINTLIRQAGELGLNTNQVRGLLVQLGLIPDKKSTKITVPGASYAARELQIIKQRLAGIHDKHIIITTTYRENGYSVQHQQGYSYGGRHTMRGLADGGIIDFYASGGIRENHIAQIAPAGSWRVWAESEDGPEAYIPLAIRKRARSREIWKEAGRRLGMPMAQLAPVSMHGGMSVAGRSQPEQSRSTVPPAAAAVHIDQFVAAPEQSPRRIAEDLWLLIKARG